MESYYLKHKRNLVEDTGPLTESESEESVSEWPGSKAGPREQELMGGLGGSY